MRTVGILLLVLLLGLPVAQAAPAGPVIGVISSFTGRFAEFGEQHRAGLTVALDELNARGGIRGQRLTLLVEDDTSSVTAALAAAEKLINQGVPLVLCCYSSSITGPVAQYFTRQRRPFLVFTSSDDSITRPGSEWVFRINQPSSTYAEVLFDVFDAINQASGGRRPIRTVALIHGNGAFETAVGTAAEGLAKGRGYTLVDKQSYDQGLTDFRPILNRFKARAPDALFMVSYAEDSVALMRQVKEVGLNAKIYAGGAAGFALPGFLSGARDAAEYVVTATAWTKDVKYPGALSLYERLKRALGGKEPSYHAAQAYAGVLTAADALRRASGTDPESVRRALRETNLMTAYGPIRFADFRGYRNQNPVKMIAEQVQRGQFVTVFPPEAAVGRILFPAPPWEVR